MIKHIIVRSGVLTVVDEKGDMVRKHVSIEYAHVFFGVASLVTAYIDGGGTFQLFSSDDIFIQSCDIVNDDQTSIDHLHIQITNNKRD